MHTKEQQKYMILTYGCQMNMHDAEKAAHLLEKRGLRKTADQEEADLILLLTCSVREKAEAKVFGKLGEMKDLKRRKPHLLLGIGGCMTQQQAMAQKVRSTFPQVDFILGTHNLHRLNSLIDEAKKGPAPVLEIWEKEEGIPMIPAKREKKYQAWIPIIYGCNNFCSYCIVPYVRGRERSRPSQEIIAEVEKLITEGVKEITLLGQNVNCYGQDRKGEMDFATLLTTLDSLPGLHRIRFTTSHPRDFHTPIIAAIAASKNICEHIHLPLQSGSAKILKKMNRGYGQQDYLERVQEMKEKIPGVAITTDILVGFPGETWEDFQATLEVVETVRFASAFTFLFSPRRNTPAAQITDPTSWQEKKERFQHLLKVQNRINWEENQRYVGQVVEVLGEGNSKKDASIQMGRTRTNRVVNFPDPRNREGEFLAVKITEARTWNLLGIVVHS